MAAVPVRNNEAPDPGALLPGVEERLALLAEASRVLADVSLEPPIVMERLCGLVVPLLGSACALRLLSEDGQWLHTVATAEASPEARLRVESLGTREARTGEAGVPPEVGARAAPALVLPLHVRGGELGTLTVWERVEGRPLDAGERVLLRELADRAALTLDVARAYAAERRARQAAEVAADRLARLQRVTAELSQVLSEEDAAEVVVDRGVGARGGGLWRVEAGDTHARLLRSTGYDVRSMAEACGSMPLDAHTPITEAIREARPVWLETPDALPTRFPVAAVLRGLMPERPAPSSVWLPLRVDGQVLGTLMFAFSEPHAFAADERAFLELLAHHAAQALARARLLEQEQRARLALAEANQRLAAIIQASPAAIMLLDLDGTVRLWNPAAERVFGWTADEVLGRFLPAVPEERRAEFRRNLEVVARGDGLSGVETQRQRRDGSAVPVALWTARVQPPGGPVQCLSVVVDISARVRGERAQRFLAEAGEVLASSLEQDETLERVAHLAVPAYAEACGVFLADDADGPRCVATAFADAGCCRAPGSPPAPGLAVVARVMASGLPELRTGVGPDAPECVRPDARDAVCAWLCVPLQVRGQTLGALTFVSSRRPYDAEDLALELARRAALAIDNARLYREARQAIRLREEFLSIASHELKTPITTLQLQVQSLQAGLERLPGGVPPERLRRGLEVVGRQVKRQAQLIDELLDVSRISAGRLELRHEPLDLSALVREVAERFEPELTRTETPLALVLPPEATGLWDRPRLDQVLTNLLSNAVKYGRGNPVHVELSFTDERVRLDVRDGGIGIAAEHLPRLFHRFERAVSERNYGGFGLGLWIARRIVEAMGGRIVVSSEPGVGSTFTVELPRARG
ncbi:ATP-binding protein [Pyxidicoccus xibeiensis]|uniref:ATP-binding protein n=1 Tax=Pyxidicoccus xibeiensis TaxID=2906759 RepID=UPI0020A6DF1F|nr:ATP-binding protein [Pyxidicoccus xibeiensis]MCP3136574.1 ATP-binding protein [Pyxidicoccus xibeiensis]